MPQFKYEVKKSPTETASGVIEAESQRAAVARLRDMGYFPLRVEETAQEKTKDAKEAIKKMFGRVRLRDRNVFFRQLANLSESGMVITRALRTIADQTENKRMAKVVDDIREDVQKGLPLADALERHPNLFPAMYIALIRAGETGGMLDEILWRIVDFGEKEEELRGKAFSAMVYPAFLTVVGSAAIFILVAFVFPKFVVVFEEFGAQLPLPTRMVMAMCDFMGRWWWAVLLALGGALFGITSWMRTEKGRWKVDTLSLRIPVLRTVVQKYEMAKFARTLGTLLDNGVPVLHALRITADTMSNRLIREEVSIIHAGVTDGEAISETLTQAKHFPPLVVSMFAVGEESGRIGAVAKRVADAYDIEVDRAVKAATALFEPLLIVIMGVIVGFLVISMLLPMLTLGNAIAR